MCVLPKGNWWTYLMCASDCKWKIYQNTWKSIKIYSGCTLVGIVHCYYTPFYYTSPELIMTIMIKYEGPQWNLRQQKRAAFQLRFGPNSLDYYVMPENQLFVTNIQYYLLLDTIEYTIDILFQPLFVNCIHTYIISKMNSANVALEVFRLVVMMLTGAYFFF